MEEKRYAIELDSLASYPLQENYPITTNESNPRQNLSFISGNLSTSTRPILDIYPNRYSAVAYQLGKAQRFPT